jgi:hypothetical protein
MSYKVLSGDPNYTDELLINLSMIWELLCKDIIRGGQTP